MRAAGVGGASGYVCFYNSLEHNTTQHVQAFRTPEVRRSFSVSGGGGVTVPENYMCICNSLEQFRAQHNRSGEAGVSDTGNYVCSCNSLEHNTTCLCSGFEDRHLTLGGLIDVFTRAVLLSKKTVELFL